MIKRLFVLVVAAVALRITGLLPFETGDVARLKPVETLVVFAEHGEVVLNWEEGSGRGNDWDAALEDLRQSAEGGLFLKTAEQIVLCGGAETLLQKIVRSEALRPAATVCICYDQTPDPKQVGKYLSAHPSELTLQQIRAAQLRGEPVELPVLTKTKGGWRLDGANNR